MPKTRQTSTAPKTRKTETKKKAPSALRASPVQSQGRVHFAREQTARPRAPARANASRRAHPHHALRVAVRHEPPPRVGEAAETHYRPLRSSNARWSRRAEQSGCASRRIGHVAIDASMMRVAAHGPSGSEAADLGRVDAAKRRRDKTASSVPFLHCG
jgi:hypothetical protein